MSPYAVSKAAQDLVLAQEHRSGGLATIRLRPFNHTGPRRPERFALSSFARQIAEIEHDQRPPRIDVGNLEAIRDFCDVRDVVKAYVGVADRRFAGAVFNVCSGRPLRLADALESLIGRSHRPIEIVTDTDRLRPSDVPILVGDPSAIHAATGWRPTLSFDDTLDDLLEWWRGRVADGAHGTVGRLQHP
jgi:GDP-4-dehydro-6-deoxy-D-mannose reductase